MSIASKKSLDVILLSSEVGVVEELIEISPSLHDLHSIRELSKHLSSTQPFRNRSSRDLFYNHWEDQSKRCLTVLHIWAAIQKIGQDIKWHEMSIEFVDNEWFNYSSTNKATDKQNLLKKIMHFVF